MPRGSTQAREGKQISFFYILTFPPEGFSITFFAFRGFIFSFDLWHKKKESKKKHSVMCK